MALTLISSAKYSTNELEIFLVWYLNAFKPAQERNLFQRANNLSDSTINKLAKNWLFSSGTHLYEISIPELIFSGCVWYGRYHISF